MPHITRMYLLTLVFAFIIITLVGCNNEEKVDVLSFERFDYQIYLYSNGEETEVENSYLSAILDLKIEHPEIFDNMSIKETSDSLLAQKDIEEFPALLIMKDGEKINLLSGKNKKQDILTLLEQEIIANGYYPLTSG